MARDHHKHPFDEETLIKLGLYRDYIKEWLPVFIKTPQKHTINIFDFFCGPGKDIDGVKGSPLIALDVIEEWHAEMKTRNLRVNLFLNEYDKKKFQALEDAIHSPSHATELIDIYTTSKDFKELFNEYHSAMNKPNTANFLFLDQNGVKQIDKNIFLSILELPKTDFIFFISSSFIVRFGTTQEFQNNLHIPRDLILGKKYYHCHRAVFEYYSKLAPAGSNVYLGQFTIKKRENIYGLIFGSRHPLGIHKFITCCWDEDPVRGEANFNIDEENFYSGQLELFDPDPKPNKLKAFERDLEEAILSKRLMSNFDAYIFALKRGFIPARHAKPVFTKLKQEGKIKEIPSLGRDTWKEKNKAPIKHA